MGGAATRDSLGVRIVDVLIGWCGRRRCRPQSSRKIDLNLLIRRFSNIEGRPFACSWSSRQRR